MKYYMGIDNGGTTTKAAIYNNIGEEIAISSTDTKMISLKADFTERDMDEMWQANCKVIKDVIEKSKINALDIKGVACCGHGKGLYLWGNNNKPTRYGIISTDNRAWEYVNKWKKNGTEDEVFDISYQHILACQPVALLAWLMDNEPHIFDNIKWVFSCKDYVRFRLTGEAYSEITDFSGTNLLNLKTKKYDIELLKLFGLESIIDMLPPLRNSTDICGYITDEVASITGLALNTPVAGGMFDIDACAIAVDAAYENRVCMIAGTWSINEYIRKDPVLDRKVLMNSIFCMPEYYLIEESSATSAYNFEWFIKNMMPELYEKMIDNKKSLYNQIDSWVDAVAVSKFCPIFTPFLMASNVHQNAKSSFIGINNHHTRADILRGVYEGIAFCHKYHFDKLMSTKNENIETIHLAGGVAYSKIWTQIFADIMNYPIKVVDVGETGAFGCAMTAAVATGEYEDFNQAAKNMVKIKDTLLPIKGNIEIYKKKYLIYKKVLECLDPIWDDIQAFTDM